MMNTQTVDRPTKGVGFYVAGVFQCICGAIMLASFGVSLMASVLSSTHVMVTLLCLAGCAIAIFLLASGYAKCRLYNLGNRIRFLLAGKQRERLSVLAQATRRDYTHLVRELRALADKGVFPGAYVDLNRREFVLGPGGPQPPIVHGNTKLTEKRRKSAAPIYAIAATFLLYALLFPMYRWFDYVLVTVAALFACIITAKLAPDRTVILEEARKTEPPKPPEKINTGNEELDEVLVKAMEYMAALTALDVAITNERIDAPVQELVHICTQIFDHVKKEPGKVRQIRQFMNYYLPTTIGLLKNYDELSRERVKGENIQKAMTKIEDAMDTILKTFRRELDDLYQDKAMDITVDIEVLQNMMDQEGIGAPKTD